MIPTIAFSLIAASLFAAGEYNLMLALYATLYHLPHADLLATAVMLFIGTAFSSVVAQFIFNNRK